ncbi:MAG: EamA family transporter [Asticcacaulis sp.]|uniref:EamA family transporter n=1 Tax=Asticcacaulis sp. TaxID=1872648 RepID=UPI0039E673A7
MALETFCFVLLAAALHATWNAVVKNGGHKLFSTILVTSTAAMLAMLLIPFQPLPAMASWPFIVASTVLQVGYYLLVARIYHVADMSQTYPLMRGTAPLLVALIGSIVLKETLPLIAWLGIAVLCFGILSLAWAGRSTAGQGVRLAFFNALVIAAYTLVDGMGVRRSGHPLAYTLWIFCLSGIPLLIWVSVRRRQAFRQYMTGNWWFGLIGGVGTITSYGIALWAMTVAPIAVISALRETSILFGMVISAVVLKERVDRARIVAACLIVGGAAALRLA